MVLVEVSIAYHCTRYSIVLLQPNEQLMFFSLNIKKRAKYTMPLGISLHINCCVILPYVKLCYWASVCRLNYRHPITEATNGRV